MKKIIIIGCPGSGKSTFARELNKITGIPIFYLDMLNWNPDRTTVPKDIFIERLKRVISYSSWIIDGNYGSTLEMRIDACDTVFFLDYPTDVCLSGIESRKGKARPDMPWIEDRDAPDDEEFIHFIKNYNTDSRPKVLSLLEKYSHKNITVFQNREESDKYLESQKTLDIYPVGVYNRGVINKDSTKKGRLYEQPLLPDEDPYGRRIQKALEPPLPDRRAGPRDPQNGGE